MQMVNRKRSSLHWITAMLLALMIAAAAPKGLAGSLVSYAAKSTAVKNGWSKDKNYYYKSGRKVTGLYKVGKKTYYFGTNGKLVKEKRAYVIKVKGKKCYYNIDEKGVVKRWKDTAELAAKQLVSLKASLNTVTNKKLEKSLKKAFLWASELKYRDNTVSKTGKKAAQYYGNYAFTMKAGDCNTQAYAFYWMAKVLEYAPKYIKGYVPVGEIYKPHAWVEIVMNGTTYVFDPNFNMTYDDRFGKTFREAFGKYAGYKFTYGSHNTYAYFLQQGGEPIRK